MGSDRGLSTGWPLVTGPSESQRLLDGGSSLVPRVTREGAPIGTSMARSVPPGAASQERVLNLKAP